MSKSGQRMLHLVPSARGDMTTAAAQSLGLVAGFCARNGIGWKMLRPEGCFIEDMRNQAVQTAIKGGWDLLLMQDPDVSFDQTAFPQLWLRLKHEGAAAVGAVVRRRARVLRVNAAKARPGCVYQHAEVGTALMLLDVKQLAKVPAPWFKRQTNDSGTRTTVGEDIAFCRKLREHGLLVMADFTFPTGHRDEQWLETAPMLRTPTASGNSGDGHSDLTAGVMHDA